MNKSVSPGIMKKSPAPKSNNFSFPIVAIGASAGGLEAMKELLKNLPSNTGMAYIYVQHLSPDHKSLLPSIVSSITKMKVHEIEDMEHMAPDNVYVIPHNKIIKVTNGHIKLLPRPKNSSVISIDVLFTSLAETHKENTIGLILSGNGRDGALGIKAIKEAGGMTIAQDDSAKVGSMPNSAIGSGNVDFVLSPKEIAHHLTAFSQKNFFRPDVKGILKEDSSNDTDLKIILDIVYKKTGVDFSHYKKAIVKRVLNHKMTRYGIKTIKEYVKLLLKKNNEVNLFYKDLLNNVTCFFRDEEAFIYLKTVLFPKLLKSKKTDETLRIWVPACSTGEEAYSIAMLLTELQDKIARKIPIQIFATDLSEDAIRKARKGEYSQSEISSVSKKNVERFFTKKGDVYHIAKELQKMCVFAPHNILLAPPFLRMDFISCRNLLINFDPIAQKKTLTTIHFALNDRGYLMLGEAETTGNSSQFFTSVNKELKVYSRKKSTGIRKTPGVTPYFPSANFYNKKNSSFSKRINELTGIEQAIDSAILSRYTPACAVVNKDMEILQFRGPISLFLTHLSGKASLNILKMMLPEIGFELRNIINKVIKTKQSIQKSGLEIKIESVSRLISIEVSLLKTDCNEPLLLIVFTMQEQVGGDIEIGKSGKANSSQESKRLTMLKEKLSTTRAEMNSIIESQETTFQELQAANEEIVSSNEEFQTLNEELETSKEEIEATNQELISSNQELQIRNDHLSESYEYSKAIINTIHEPILILDKDFHIRSANKSFYKKFLFKKVETEGKFLFELGNGEWNIPNLRKELSKIFSKKSSFENFEVNHSFSKVGEKKLMLNAQLIIQKANSDKLILFAIEDITERFQYYAKEKYALSLIEASLDPLVTINIDGKITDINEATVNITGISREKLKGTDFFDYFTEPQKAREVYQEVFAKGSVADSPLTLRHRKGKLTDVLFNGSVYKDERGSVLGVVIVARDVTDQKRIAKELNEAKIFAELATGIAEDAKEKAESATLIAEEAVKSKQQFLSNMSHEIRTPMNAIIGFTKVVLKTELSAKQMEYLSAIKISGDALIVLINDILDLAKVDAGKMSFEKIPFKMSASISSMIHLFETKILEKNLKLVKKYDNRIPEVLLGDPVRLHQIILNLVSNAIKFTSTGKITVSVNLVSEDEDKAAIEFAVTDTGIGIPESKISSIFENFQQATSDTSRLFGGTGLGLAIVKQLIEPQGGTISVKSKIDEGSTFSFILNFQKTNIELELETGILELNTEIKNIKVLVVEDIPLNQLLMKTLLDDFGFERDFASNGKIAIEKLQTKLYDIILMDLQMPEMNGFEATEFIRNKMNSQIPILALTADVTTVDLAKCKAVGMNDYIAKPIDEKLLYNKIVGLVKKQIPLITEGGIKKGNEPNKKNKCTDLKYLNQRTKSNPKLMMEMISLYLDQTPKLIRVMKQSLNDKDWTALQAAVHKMIPSFSIMGMQTDFENIAKKLQENAGSQIHLDQMPDLVLKLENICAQACAELLEDFKRIESAKVE